MEGEEIVTSEPPGPSKGSMQMNAHAGEGATKELLWPSWLWASKCDASKQLWEEDAQLGIALLDQNCFLACFQNFSHFYMELGTIQNIVP